jgi:hypothetical protein
MKTKLDSLHKVNQEYQTSIRTGKYGLSVKVIEIDYKGDDGLDMATSMPGTFLESEVVLTNISGELSALEQLAIPYLPFEVFEKRDEITSQPEGYSELCYKALVKKMQNSQDLVEHAIRQKVKEKL